MKRSNHPSDSAIAEVAWLYYVKDLKQGEIAQRLGLSRPTIIAYLKAARDRRLMDVKISGVHFTTNTLAEALQQHYGLERVSVVPATGNDNQDLIDVAEAAAHYLPDFVEPGDTLGVSWGQTVSLVSERVPWWPIRNLTVRQLIGSMANPLLPTCESCTTEISNRLSAHCINLNAPAVCTDADLKERLTIEPIIASQLADMRSCNKAIYSLSPCTRDTHVVQFKIATKKDIATYKAKGAVGIIVGRFIDTAGNPVISDLDNRIIGADHSMIHSMAGLLVVSGVSKKKGTHAALIGGYASELIVGQTLAEALLKGRS